MRSGRKPLFLLQHMFCCSISQHKTSVCGNQFSYQSFIVANAGLSKLINKTSVTYSITFFTQWSDNRYTLQKIHLHYRVIHM